jgi:hypothetical protein
VPTLTPLYHNFFGTRGSAVPARRFEKGALDQTQNKRTSDTLNGKLSTQATELDSTQGLVTMEEMRETKGSDQSRTETARSELEL